MSIINKMLQDLDRRGVSDPEAKLVQEVRSVPPPRKDREWFWRIMAVLLIASVGWVAWITWQLRSPQPVATELAFKAAQNASRRPASPSAAAAVVPAPTPAESKPVPTQAPAEPKPVPTPASAESTPAPKVAEAIEAPPGTETPIRKQAPKPALKAAARDVQPTAAPAARAAAAKAGAGTKSAVRLDDLDVPRARILEAPVPAATRVQKLDRARSAEDRAETEFRRGATLLNQGRVAEAEDAFAAALSISAAHEAARQALVALHLEQGRIDEARRLLQEGVAVNPGNARFATVLARIYVERRDFAAALDVMNAVKAPEQVGAEFQSMRGLVLQQLGRHAEAIEAFQNALRGAPQTGAVWMGLGISLETMARKAEAAEAFRRATATGSLDAEARRYAEQRARQLR